MMEGSELSAQEPKKRKNVFQDLFLGVMLLFASRSAVPETTADIITIVPTGLVGPKVKLPLGERFHVEFPRARRMKYFLVLQKSSQGWGLLAAAPVRKNKVVYLPAPDEIGCVRKMREDNDAGVSRFTLIQSVRPFPEFVYALVSDGIPPSRTDLALLLRHLEELPKADRTLHAIDIDFTRD